MIIFSIASVINSDLVNFLSLYFRTQSVFVHVERAATPSSLSYLSVQVAMSSSLLFICVYVLWTDLSLLR